MFSHFLHKDHFKMRNRMRDCHSNITLKIFLTKNFRGANPAAVDKNGKTPLQTAVEMGALTDEELFLMLS